MNVDRRFLALLVLGLAFSGCSGNDEPDWQYGQADMEAAFLGTWSGTITPTDKEAAPLTVTIRSHDDVARAPACGNRDFSGDEATPGLRTRCLEVTSLAVSGTVVGDGDESEDGDGWISSYGLSLDSADFWLEYRSSQSRVMRASWNEGVWSHCTILDGEYPNEGSVATCTLDELDGMIK
jgi:hypothetical protein